MKTYKHALFLNHAKYRLKLSPADGALLHQLLTETNQYGLIPVTICTVLNYQLKLLEFLTQVIKNNKKFLLIREFDEISQ